MKQRRTMIAAALSLILPLSATAAPESGIRLEDYRIGYEALLANGDVEDAYQLALDVSRRFPKDHNWQRRLAQVATWTNRPVEAYNAWKGLYKAGVRDDEVLKEVRRLGTHFNDAPLLIELRQEEQTGHRLSKKEAENLAALYERAYRPLEGARYFEKLFKKQHRTLLGEQAAQLYRRAGKDADAVRVYRALLAAAPGNADWAITAARLEMQRDRRAAFNLLKRQQRHMADNEFEYWQMLGDLAWLYQDDATARAAYRHAAIKPKATLTERDRLTYLLMEEDPLQAAAMAMRYYGDGAGSAWLLRALEIQVAQNAWQEARRSLASARGEEISSLLENSHFLLLRAQIGQHFGDSATAVEDMRAALALAPDDADVRFTALWVFIAANDHDALEAMIATTRPDNSNPRYWQALATAYQVLGRNREALDYYRMQLERAPNDPILMLSYAELLQNTGHVDMAAQLQQQAWQRLQKAPASKNGERFLARIRTELANQPGDDAALRVRRLVEQDKDLPPALMRELDELLLTWALENGQYDSVRAWSQQRFGDTQQMSAWARLQLAMATNDHHALQQLLESEGENLPAANAHEAATITGRWPLARQLAFAGAQRNPDDDELHQRLVETNELYGDFVEAAGQKAYYSDLDSGAFRLRADKGISESWRLSAEAERTEQSLHDTTQLRSIPERDNRVTLAVLGSTPRHDWRVALEAHRELTDYFGWQAGYSRALGGRVQLDLLLAGRQSTEHTTALQVAGYADRALLGADWAADRRLSLNALFASERYYTQHDAYLGSGAQLSWEAVYHLRSAYPDWNLRLYGSHYRFSADGTPDYATLQQFTTQTLADTPVNQRSTLFIPVDNDYYGLCGGAGQYLRDRYSRALRPLADACAINSKVDGTGYSLLAGLSGSPSGKDQLTLLWERSHAGRQAAGRDVHVITLRYRLYF